MKSTNDQSYVFEDDCDCELCTELDRQDAIRKAGS